MRSRLIAPLFVIAALAASEASADTTTDQRYTRVITDVVVPGFGQLVERTQAHAAAWQAYCASPSPTGQAEVENSFHALADQWATVEMIRTGPATDDFRFERFNFWPERKNAVKRGLVALNELAATRPVTAADIKVQSAAVQGLPALERLIFETGDEGQANCALGPAIAENAARLATEIHEGWSARASLVSEQAKADLATDLVVAYSFIEDKKIEAVIGSDIETVKSRAAEFWRSGRSVRTIRFNLEGLNRINAILFEPGDDEKALPATTASAIAIAASLPGDLGALAEGPDRSSAVLLRDAVDAAKDRAVIELPATLGVTIGFNSLDGD